MKNYYFGGYPSEHNDGIYCSDADFKDYKQIVNAQYTTYFDVRDIIATILKENNLGGIGIYDLQGNCLAKKLMPLKPACYLEIKDNLIYTAHYHDGQCLIYEWNQNELTLRKQLFFGREAKCHEVLFYDQKHEFGVVCLGLDKIIFFDENYEQTKEILFPEGSGPRHALFNHDQSLLYVISELSKELFVYDMNQNTFIQQISLLENDQEGSGAAIRLSSDGKHLYTSVRYADILTHFEWGEQGWQPKQYYHCRKTPRDFILSEDTLIAAYQDENFVEKLSLDENKNVDQVLCTLPLEKIVCVKEK